jgi:hypothetical protein
MRWFAMEQDEKEGQPAKCWKRHPRFNPRIFDRVDLDLQDRSTQYMPSMNVFVVDMI